MRPEPALPSERREYEMGSFWQILAEVDAPVVITVVSGVGLLIFCAWAVLFLDGQR